MVLDDNVEVTFQLLYQQTGSHINGIYSDLWVNSWLAGSSHYKMKKDLRTFTLECPQMGLSPILSPALQ